MSSQSHIQCKPRFKGIENFLRKVAFNLGNTPSQTEVKIISCIPVDVTDLQHKIILLEKALEEANKASKGTNSNKAVEANRAAEANKAPEANNADETRRQSDAVVNTSLYTTQFKPTTYATTLSLPPECSSAPESSRSKHSVSGQSRKKSNVSVKNTAAADEPVTLKTVEDTHEPKRKHNMFFRGKTQPKKEKYNAHAIYYAQTLSSPFNNVSYYNQPTADTTSRYSVNDTDLLTPSYLTQAMCKQYQPYQGEITSEFSQSSFPVCRDEHSICQSPYKHPDLCSCCAGPFHNIENVNCSSAMRNEYANQNIYYDSSLYDLIPVRELSDILEGERVKKEYFNTNIPEKYISEQNRKPFNKSQPRQESYIATFHKAESDKISHKMYSKQNMSSKSYRKYNTKLKRKPVLNASNSCSVVCGDVYMRKQHKETCAKNVSTSSTPITSFNLPRTVIQKNAECLTVNVNSIECQTVTNRSVQLDPIQNESVNSQAIEEIKTILQSFLTEAKSMSQPKDASAAQQDVRVQKLPSLGNIQTSSNRLTNNNYPCNTYNPCAPTHLDQINSGQLCYPASPFAAKCLQNYPLFIQTTGRNMYACCNRHNQNPGQCSHRPAATNTEADHARSKETEKLIKEIYKSMAINIDYPIKNTTTEYGANCANNNYARNAEIRQSAAARAKGRGDGAKRTADASTAPISTDATFYHSRVRPHSSRVKVLRREVDREPNYKVNKYLQPNVDHSVPVEAKRNACSTQRSDELSSDEDTESPLSETDSDATMVATKTPIQKTEKKHLWSKMVRLFKGKKQHKIEVTEETADSCETDYRTCHREAQKQNSHSKTDYTACYMSPREHDRPYMEQEIRRHWHEDLMFHGSTSNRYSSEKAVSKQSSKPQRPLYWQDCTHACNVRPRMYEVDHVPKHSMLNNNDRENVSERFAADGNRGINLTWFRKQPKCGEHWKRRVDG